MQSNMALNYMMKVQAIQMLLQIGGTLINWHVCQT